MTSSEVDAGIIVDRTITRLGGFLFFFSQSLNDSYPDQENLTVKGQRRYRKQYHRGSTL